MNDWIDVSTLPDTLEVKYNRNNTIKCIKPKKYKWFKHMNYKIVPVYEKDDKTRVRHILFVIHEQTKADAGRNLFIYFVYDEGDERPIKLYKKHTGIMFTATDLKDHTTYKFADFDYSHADYVDTTYLFRQLTEEPLHNPAFNDLWGVVCKLPKMSMNRYLNYMCYIYGYEYLLDFITREDINMNIVAVAKDNLVNHDKTLNERQEEKIMENTTNNVTAGAPIEAQVQEQANAQAFNPANYMKPHVVQTIPAPTPEVQAVPQTQPVQPVQPVQPTQAQPTLSSLINNSKSVSINEFLKRVAEAETSLSPIMAGRESVKMDYICERYPDGVTVDGVDIITTTIEGESKQCPVFTYAEDSSVFAFGGTVLMNIINAWIKALNKPVNEVSQTIKEAGGVRMRFTKTSTKKGNNVFMVTIL